MRLSLFYRKAKLLQKLHAKQPPKKRQAERRKSRLFCLPYRLATVQPFTIEIEVKKNQRKNESYKRKKQTVEDKELRKEKEDREKTNKKKKLIAVPKFLFQNKLNGKKR